MSGERCVFVKEVTPEKPILKAFLWDGSTQSFEAISEAVGLDCEINSRGDLIIWHYRPTSRTTLQSGHWLVQYPTPSGTSYRAGNDEWFKKVFIVHSETYQSELKKLREELEIERMRLAGCGVAALGYFDGCAEDYKSASLDDVLRLWDSNKKLREERDKLVECVKEIAKQEQETGMWKVPTYEAQIAQKTLRDIGEV